MSRKLLKLLMLIITLGLMFNFSLGDKKEAFAYKNLIKTSDFEKNLSGWDIWQDQSSTRQIVKFRSYDVPFGYGSYAMGIKVASGDSEATEKVTLMTDNTINKFSVSNDSNYYLSFYAKSSSDYNLNLFIQNNQTYKAISNIENVELTSDWNRYLVKFSPSEATGAVLVMMLGDLQNGQSVLIDGVQLYESDLKLITKTLSGKVGDKNKAIKINNIHFFEQDEVEIELPYYDETSLSASSKRFKPTKIGLNTIFVDLPVQTFPGIGRVYVNNFEVGRFNYKLAARIESFYPSQVRADQDVTIVSNGFNPQTNYGTLFLVVKVIGTDGKTYNHYITPHIIDPKLKQFTVELPVGVRPGSMFVQTSYEDVAGNIKVSKSNIVAYKVKPVIYNLEWSRDSYNQVGDKITIFGKGISYNPVVRFYDESGKFRTSVKAQVLSIGAEEIIEAKTPANLNKMDVTVSVGGVESDITKSLSYTAKSKLLAIASRYSRKDLNSNTKIMAAKVGDEITVKGKGIYSSFAPTMVSFSSLDGRTDVEPVSFSKDKSSLKVLVPDGSLSGHINVLLNGESSNWLHLEIVPSVLSVEPSSIMPGSDLVIKTNGVGPDLSELKIIFKDTQGTFKSVDANNITFSGTDAIINATSPMGLSSNSSRLNVKYGYWEDNSSVNLTVDPSISDASIDLDTKILYIKGQGFSTKASQNKITYMLADEDKTVTQPKAKMLGVFNIETGQEIRVKLLDNYHYGWVRMEVNGQTSNEVNFGPVDIKDVSRRVQLVESEGRIMGVLYISGYNFGPTGGVKVGDVWADVHYRTDFFIIAVVEQADLYKDPVVVAK